MARHRALPPHRRTPPSTAYVPPPTARPRPVGASPDRPTRLDVRPAAYADDPLDPPTAYADPPTAYRPVVGDLTPAYDDGEVVTYDDHDPGPGACELDRRGDYRITYDGGRQLAVFLALVVLGVVLLLVVVPVLLT